MDKELCLQGMINSRLSNTTTIEGKLAVNNDISFIFNTNQIKLESAYSHIIILYYAPNS